jgi:hypothetical protein
MNVCNSVDAVDKGVCMFGSITSVYAGQFVGLQDQTERLFRGPGRAPCSQLSPYASRIYFSCTEHE